jgi:hypothetical protein
METIQSRVDDLITQMTPAEKAGQLTQYFYVRFPRDRPDQLPCRRGARGCQRCAICRAAAVVNVRGV